MPRAIGIDVGGTKIAAGLVDLADGLMHARKVQPTEVARGGEAILNDVMRMASAWRGDADTLGIGIAELVNRDGEIASNATIDWMALAAREKLAAILPTRFEADVRAAARAEARFGAGQQSRCFLYVTVGTGISCSLVIDGKPFLGARGLTGTFASAATFDGPPLEAISSGLALAHRYANRAGEREDARGIVALAEAGNALAREIVESAGLALGAAIAHLANTLDPEFVVVGGGLGCAPGHFHSALKIGFANHLWSQLHRDMPIHPAKLGPDAGIIGAALASVEF